MKTLLTALALFLSGGVAYADHDCPCEKDACKCALDACPAKCPRDLAAANKAVAKGSKVVLCLGVPAIPGAYSCEARAGYVSGVYDCEKDAKGVHVMRLRVSAAPAIQYGALSNPFQTGGCVNGNCPAPSVRYRR
jgi:hypothetical protein